MSGGCRPGACSACHRDHPSIAGPQRAVPGSTRWLAGLARDTGILSRICRTTRRNILLKPALSASCRKTNMTGNPSGCLVLPHHTTRSRGRLGRCRAPGHPDSCRICPHPPQALELPRSPRRFDVPGVPGVGLPDSGHATGWIWLARSSYSIGVSMPGDEWQPRRFRRDRSRRAGRGGRYPAPSLRPRGLPAGARPAGSIRPGQAGRHTGARAGSPLRTSQVTTTIALRPWSPSGTGRTLDGPVSMRDRVPGPGRARARARVFAPAILAGRAGKVPAAGQFAGHTVSTSRGFRDRLAKAGGERSPGHGGARHAQPRGQDGARHGEVVQR